VYKRFTAKIPEYLKDDSFDAEEFNISEDLLPEAIKNKSSQSKDLSPLTPNPILLKTP